MQLTDFTNNRKLIIGAIAVAVVILLAIVISSSRGQKPQPETAGQSVPQTNTGQINVVPPPQASPKPEKTVEDIKQQIIQSPIRDDNGDLILYEENAYEIKYVPAPDVFFVTIKQTPAQTYKEEAEEWFKSFGLTEKDLCALPIRFLLQDLRLRQQNPDFSSLPTDCK